MEKYPFDVNRDERETAAIKQFINTPNFFNLIGNNMYKWVAINIPLDAFSNGKIKGDVDLALGLRYSENHGEEHPKYTDFIRAFEVKSCSLAINGEASSLKVLKTDKIIQQAKKLIDFGFEQVFLADFCVVQPEKPGGNIPDFYNSRIIELIKTRMSKIKEEGMGYVFMIDQPIIDMNRQVGRSDLLPINLDAKTRPSGKFSELFLRKIEELIQDYNGKSTPVVLYCEKCREYYVRSKEDVYRIHACSILKVTKKKLKKLFRRFIYYWRDESSLVEQ